MASRMGVISGVSFMSMSIILLVLFQRGTVTYYVDDGKAVVPLRAFLERRPLNDHDNATIILVQVKKGILSGNKITGCGVGSETATEFEVLLLNSYKNFVHRFYPSLTHDEAIIICYDLKFHQGTDQPFITYRNAYNYPIQVQTKLDLTLTIGVGMERNSSINPRVLLCATELKGTRSFSNEWIQYQKNLGVDFIHLYTTQTDKFLDVDDSEILHVDHWESTLGEELYHQSQYLWYMDCLYRYQGLFDYVLVYDTSDYFIPMIPNKFDIRSYIKVIFHQKHTGSVLFRRVVYSVGDRCKFKAQLRRYVMKMPSNISNILDHYEFKELGLLTKGMHKLSAIVEISPQKAVSLLPGYVTERISPEIAYVVHIRNLLPCT